MNIITVDGCSAASVSVQVLATVIIEGTGVKDYVGDIWSKSALLSSGDLRNRVIAEVESLSKELVVDWNSVNKP